MRVRSIGLYFYGRRKAKIAVMSIVPAFVNHMQARRGPIAIRLDTPFAIGFLTVFITIVANQRALITDDDMIGSIQAEVLADIIGCEATLAGELISFESARYSPDFILRCEKAALFCEHLFQAIDVRELEYLGRRYRRAEYCQADYFAALCKGSSQREHLLDDWSDHFERHL